MPYPLTLIQDIATDMGVTDPAENQFHAKLADEKLAVSAPHFDTSFSELRGGALGSLERPNRRMK